MPHVEEAAHRVALLEALSSDHLIDVQPTQGPSGWLVRIHLQSSKPIETTYLEPVDAPVDSSTLTVDFKRVLRDAFLHEAELFRIVGLLGSHTTVDDLMGIIRAVLEPVTESLEPAVPAEQFTKAELEELEQAGADLTPIHFGSAQTARTAGLFARLIATALTVAETAERLGVDESRIRQRITEQTLYGVKVGRSWRLPNWQFAEEQGSATGTIPGLGIVLHQLPAALHPVAVWRWMTRPIEDLEFEDGPSSPRDWLLSGGDPDAVAVLAADL